MRDNFERKKDAERKALADLYNNYLHRTCSEFISIESRWEVFDAVLMSGDSRVVLEHKNRDDHSLLQYINEGAVLETKKFDALKAIYEKYHTPVLYVNHWTRDGYIFIWDVTRHFRDTYELTSGYQYSPCQSYGNGNAFTNKPVLYLPFEKADFIIRSCCYDRISAEQFTKEMGWKIAESDRWLEELLNRENNLN